MTLPATAGFIVANNEAIWGTGDTADAAWADALANMEHGTVLVEEGEDPPEDGRPWTRTRDYRILPATTGLLVAVEGVGGDLPWEVVRGVACMPHEAEAA